ncbi:hypothetical protein GE191_13125 [Serratia fonticola]|uniref:hypothetical protein n=1 Tax=Serratia fonticola TaxID=47917 RepID=UPI0013785AAC|nr:hypothetical protein [Serratia fonticola]NBJ34624.1 hypothetical protein [Serratia fonticola]
MRNKGYSQPQLHPEVKRARFLQSVDKKSAKSFASVAKTELFKARARAAMATAPREKGFVFIPNDIMDDLLKSDLSVEQFNEVLKVFDPRGIE